MLCLRRCPLSQSNVVTDSAPVPRFRDAYQTLLDQIRAVPADELIGTSQMYASREARDGGMQSVKQNAPIA
jgi:hypothetical protein